MWQIFCSNFRLAGTQPILTDYKAASRPEGIFLAFGSWVFGFWVFGFGKPPTEQSKKVRNNSNQWPQCRRGDAIEPLSPGIAPKCKLAQWNGQQQQNRRPAAFNYVCWLPKNCKIQAEPTNLWPEPNENRPVQVLRLKTQCPQTLAND